MEVGETIRRSWRILRQGIAVAAFALAGSSAAAQTGTSEGQWPTYGGDLASTKYAPLDQIDASNVGDLEIQWRWQTVDAWVSKTVAGGEWWSPSAEVFNDLQNPL